MGAFNEAYRAYLADLQAAEDRQLEEAKRAYEEEAANQQRFNDFCVMAKSVFESAVKEAAEAQCYGKASVRPFEAHAVASLELELPGVPKRVVRIVARLEKDGSSSMIAEFKDGNAHGDRQFHRMPLGYEPKPGAEQEFDAALGVCLNLAFKHEQ